MRWLLTKHFSHALAYINGYCFDNLEEKSNGNKNNLLNKSREKNMYFTISSSKQIKINVPYPLNPKTGKNIKKCDNGKLKTNTKKQKEILIPPHISFH